MCSENNTFYRPRWTCGRYHREKHVAIMYNLIAGYSFFFENYSADIIGLILQANRDTEISIDYVAETTKIAMESIENFFNQLLSHGLLVDHIYTEDEISKYRKSLRNTAKNHLNSNTENKRSPIDTSNAEQMYYDAVDDGSTVCSVMFELTYRCSEKCIHCYNPGATRNDEEESHRGALKELTLEEYKRIIDDLIENGLVKVCLSGGDPFSHKDVWSIIDYLYQKEIAFDIFTNGLHIIKDTKRLADYFPRLVGVSIYSGVDKDHDAITRIPNSWQRSMQVVKELAELAVPMNLKCCIMQPNLHSYYMVADIASQLKIKPQFEINITESNDGDLCAKQLRLTEQQLDIVLRDYNLVYYVGPEVISYGGYKRGENDSPCGAGRTTFCITPNGDLRACTAFTLSYGNLRENSFKDIVQNSISRKKWLETKLKDFIECGKHEYCDYCNLCVGINYTEHGDYLQPAETNCYMAKVRYHLAQKLKSSYSKLNREQFVDALQNLPIKEVTLQRQYHTKG